jgi:hypothetical protein
MVRAVWDRWWRVWARPAHLDGLTGVREFGRVGPLTNKLRDHIVSDGEGGKP